MSKLIDYSAAIDLVLKNAYLMKSENIRMGDGLGRTLAQDIVSNSDLPRFTSSAVDGYGVKVSDILNASKENPVVIKLVGEIKAGDYSMLKLSRDECVRILTGAPVPLSIEAVVMKEFTKQVGDKIIFITSSKLGENKRYKGEEFKKGTKIISRGTLISPAVLGIIASLGIQKVKVYQKPKVTLLVTGNELVAVGKKLKYGQIYDSNFYTLSSALKQMGINALNLGIAKDDKISLNKKIKLSIEQSDVLLVSGGISVGEYDYVQEIFHQLKIKKIFWRVAVKPGKPTYFGVKGSKIVFGLPGNPVAAYVIFHQLVKPAIRKMMGEVGFKPKLLFATLDQELYKRSRRLEFVRGVLKYSEEGDLHVTPISGRGSHMLGSMATADCLILFPKDSDKIERGSRVQVNLIY